MVTPFQKPVVQLVLKVSRLSRQCLNVMLELRLLTIKTVNQNRIAIFDKSSCRWPPRLAIKQTYTTMKIALKINWVLVILLSIATGAFKLSQQPEDIELFSAIGMNATATMILGAIQLIGGILMIPGRTRITGAWIMIPTYVLASIAVFANSMLVFGIVSLLFITMAYGVIHMEKNKTLK